VVKQVALKARGIVNNDVDGWVGFDSTQDPNLDLGEGLDPGNWKLQITRCAEAYVSLGACAGTFATVDVDAGVLLDVPSEFSGDDWKCAPPSLYGRFSAAVFAIIKADVKSVFHFMSSASSFPGGGRCGVVWTNGRTPVQEGGCCAREWRGSGGWEASFERAGLSELVTLQRGVGREAVICLWAPVEPGGR
jgi:hypothetical protein